MRVKATRRGFYVKLREPRDEFDVPDELFSKRWMKRIEATTEEAPVVVLKMTEPATPAVPVVKKRRGGRPKKVQTE